MGRPPLRADPGTAADVGDEAGVSAILLPEATLEEQATTLSENPRGVLLARDKLAGWSLGSTARRRKGGSPDGGNAFCVGHWRYCVDFDGSFARARLVDPATLSPFPLVVVALSLDLHSRVWKVLNDTS